MEKLLLIADAGSTKIDWRLVDFPLVSVHSFKTKGMNPVISSPEHINQIFTEVKKEIYKIFGNNLKLDSIPFFLYYYGAGCATKTICDKVRAIAEDNLANLKKCVVQSDLEGAAKALFGDKPGLAAILGTGSNLGIYDGQKIVLTKPSLGYILGDEGSGNAIGKRLLNEYFKGLMPYEISILFEKEFHLTISEVLHHVYNCPGANAYLASFAKFASDHISETDYLRKLVGEEIGKFFTKNVFTLPHSAPKEIGFCGSIASVFKPIIKDEAEKFGCKIADIIKEPIQNLQNYHIEKFEEWLKQEY